VKDYGEKIMNGRLCKAKRRNTAEAMYPPNIVLL
jgi:hypothetical protein